MANLQKLVIRLDEILDLKKSTSLSVLGDYIIGAIQEQPYELYEQSQLIQELDDLASKLALNDGTPNELEKAWNLIITRIQALKDSL